MVIEKGYAKLNLGLEVVRKREDGYHDLSMVMTTINLYDELYFEEIDNDKIIIDCEKLDYLKPEDNLVYKSIDLIKKKYNINKGIKVKIIKRIPEQAGLGGGSADAAATLRAMNSMWKLGLTLEELAKLGANIGSDIPFCIYNKTAKVSGRGEIIEFIDEIPFAYVLLVFPNFKSSTAEVFKKFKLHGLNKEKINDLVLSISEGDINNISNNLFNDLEISIDNNEINEIKKDLNLSGALNSVMTGSGSTVFGISPNEQDAKKVEYKFIDLSVKKYGLDKNGRVIIVTTFRSSRKQIIKDNLPRQNLNKKVNIIDTIDTKAYGMLMLGYQNIWNNYKMIMTPIGLYNFIKISKIEDKRCEVFVNGVQCDGELTKNLIKLINVLNYGLIVYIEEKINKKYCLFNDDIYLSTIIFSLSKYEDNIDKLYNIFSKKVEAYKEFHTFIYDSKVDQYKKLNDAVFGYVIIAPLNINEYKSPRYTKQINIETKELEAIIKGINDKNFFMMSSNLFNSTSKFETRQIEEIKGSGYINNIYQNCSNNNATGFTLSIEGKAIICLCRYEKHANKIESLLKNKFKFKDTIVTTIRSKVLHQISVSPVLKAVEYNEVNQIENIFDYDESNPFVNTDIIEDEYIEDQKYYSKHKKKEKIKKDELYNDFEGILSLHSGGSIFKQYDFIDIAKYFEKFFHGKYINFIINNKNVPVRFDTSFLPHILGIHLINEKDYTFRGRLGFEKMLKGEISYNKLKKSGVVDENIIKEIFKRTQSSILIFNDIFNNRLNNIYCFGRNFILNENSKMDKFEYGITRKLSDSSFHIQNLLGIGRDPNSNNYFFLTSYIWKVPANVGKKDSYKIGISR